MKAAIFLCLALCSCEINHYKATSATGNTVEETNLQAGGTRSNRRSDGSSYANDYQASFQQFMQTAGVLAGGYFTAVTDGNRQAANAYVNANGVVTNANGNVAGYLGKVVPPGGLAPGQTVPVLTQQPPLPLPKFNKP